MINDVRVFPISERHHGLHRPLMRQRVPGGDTIILTNILETLAVVVTCQILAGRVSLLARAVDHPQVVSVINNHMHWLLVLLP